MDELARIIEILKEVGDSLGEIENIKYSERVKKELQSFGIEYNDFILTYDKVMSGIEKMLELIPEINDEEEEE